MKPVHIDRWNGQGEIKRGPGAAAAIGTIDPNRLGRSISRRWGCGSCLPFPLHGLSVLGALRATSATFGRYGGCRRCR
jgi:hypothetical protein